MWCWSLIETIKSTPTSPDGSSYQQDVATMLILYSNQVSYQQMSNGFHPSPLLVQHYLPVEIDAATMFAHLGRIRAASYYIRLMLPQHFRRLAV